MLLLKTFGSLVFSLAIVLLLMPKLINYLKKISFNQAVSEYSLKEFQEKAKTPTMGGILFVLTPIFITLVFFPSSLFDLDVQIIILAFFGYGMIGFLDDYIIVIKNNNDGLLPKHKFILQVVLAVIFYFIYVNHITTDISLPFTDAVFSIDKLYGLLVFFMFVGSSNAVNLTDGMDGLAAGCSLISLIPFLIFAIVQNQISIAIFIAALIGALLGYLKYNVTPAKIFMGDTGSLALGGVLAALAMVLKVEFAFIFIGGVFVWETLCVIIQIGSVKLRNKRVFRYTPIHYSFVLQGIKEQRVVRSFWILAAVLSFVGLIFGIF